MKCLAIAILIVCALAHQAPSLATPITIRFATPYDATQPVSGTAAEYLASQLSAGIEDQIDVVIDRTQADILSALIDGKVDLATIPSDLLAKDNMNMRLFDLPFLFLDLDDLLSLQTSYLGEAILGSTADSGLVGLAYWNNGLNRLFSKQQIDNIAGLSGLRLWTQLPSVMHRTVMEIGPHPITLSPAEGLEAINQGKIDAADLALISVGAQPSKYAFKQVLDLGWRPDVAILAANAKFWDALPYRLQVKIAAITHRVQDVVNHEAYNAEKQALDSLIMSDFRLNRLAIKSKADLRQRTTDAWKLSLGQQKSRILEDARLILANTNIQNPERRQQEEERQAARIFFVTDRSLAVAAGRTGGV
jgi:C4-dicarboxylate-binding protein DctP